MLEFSSTMQGVREAMTVFMRLRNGVGARISGGGEVFVNALWLIGSSSFGLLSTLLLSSKLSLEDFGVATGFITLAGFLSILGARGQPGVVLSCTEHVNSRTIIHSFKRAAPVLVLVALGSVLWGIRGGSPYLTYVLPLVALGVMSQFMMSVSQATLSLRSIGFYQSLPVLARSSPAVFVAAMAYWGGDIASVDQYLRFTGIFSAILVVIVGAYYIFRNTEPLPPVPTLHGENSFWLVSLLAAAYATATAPLVLAVWGAAAAGVYGIYLMLWGIANIAITSIFNNYLLPRYAAIRSEHTSARLLVRRAIVVATATSILILVCCLTTLAICMKYVWPASYSEYLTFFLICTGSLALRPFSAAIGLPLNFTSGVTIKLRIQLCSVAFLMLSLIALSQIRNFELLGLSIVAAELIVLCSYYRRTRL